MGRLAHDFRGFECTVSRTQFSLNFSRAFKFQSPPPGMTLFSLAPPKERRAAPAGCADPLLLLLREM